MTGRLTATLSGLIAPSRADADGTINTAAFFKETIDPAAFFKETIDPADFFKETMTVAVKVVTVAVSDDKNGAVFGALLANI